MDVLRAPRHTRCRETQLRGSQDRLGARQRAAGTAALTRMYMYPKEVLVGGLHVDM